jgi:hypothetical protein
LYITDPHERHEPDHRGEGERVAGEVPGEPAQPVADVLRLVEHADELHAGGQLRLEGRERALPHRHPGHDPADLEGEVPLVPRGDGPRRADRALDRAARDGGGADRDGGLRLGGGGGARPAAPRRESGERQRDGADADPRRALKKLIERRRP